MEDVGLYTVNADGGVTARTKDSQLLTLWRNAEGWAQVVTDHSAPKTATYHYDPSGERSEKLVTGVFGVVLDARYYVDASYEVDTVANTHEVHLFVGSRRVATAKRGGLGTTATASIASVTTYHSDQVGTNAVTTVSTASAQTVSKTYIDPFGEKKSGTGNDPRYLFTDQERDAESSLDYFGARFYDAWAGRFIEQDPELIGPGSGAGAVFDAIAEDGQFGNAYSYALNRATAMVDPSGRIPYWALGATVAFAGTMHSPGDSKSDSGNDSSGAQASGAEGSDDAGSGAGNSSGGEEGSSEPAPEGIETIVVTGHHDVGATSSIGEIEALGVEYVSLSGLGAFDFGYGQIAGGIGPLQPGLVLYGAYLAQRFGPAGGEFVRRTAEALLKNPTLNASQIKAIGSHLSRISQHVNKLVAFQMNPTVRPGMERLSQAAIQQQQQARVQHLQTEIQTFQNNIIKILGGGP